MSIIVAEFIAEFSVNRHEVVMFPKEHAKKIVSFYDEMTAEILTYLESKWLLNLKPVFKVHFNHVWGMNTYIIGRSDWTQTKIKRYNSASMMVGDALRRIGERHGFLQAANPEPRGE